MAPKECDDPLTPAHGRDAAVGRSTARTVWAQPKRGVLDDWPEFVDLLDVVAVNAGGGEPSAS